MIIRLPTRIRVHHAGFGRRVDARRGSLIDFARHRETRRSGDFPLAARPRLQVNCLASGSAGLDALIADRCSSQGALLMRPIIAVGAEGALRFCGMALQRIRILTEPPDHPAPQQFAECGSLVFAASDWQRHAPMIVKHVVSGYVPEPTRNDVSDAFELPRLAFDFPRDEPAKLGEVAPASVAIVNALGRGQRAVFGLESFASEYEFLQACAQAIALLPSALHTDLSIAAGFVKPLPDALIQWVGVEVSTPPAPGALATTMSNLPPGMSIDEARAYLVSSEAIKPMAVGEIGGDPLDNDPFEDRARSRLRDALGAALPPVAETTAKPFAHLLSVLEKAASRHAEPLAADAAQDAAQAIDACFGERSPEVFEPFSVSRWSRALQRLRDDAALPCGDPLEVAESLTEIEAVLAGADAIANSLCWTDGLERMSKAAVAALRVVTIEKPHGDANVGVAFLLSLARAPNSLHIVGALIGAGDSAVRVGVEHALMATALLSGEIDGVRPELIRSLLGSRHVADPVEPSRDSAVRGVA